MAGLRSRKEGTSAMFMSQKRATFQLLWDMVNTIQDSSFIGSTGQVISRYASMIDDRIENSGNSRSTDSLKLYTIKQLQDEIDSREKALKRPTRKVQ